MLILYNAVGTLADAIGCSLENVCGDFDALVDRDGLSVPVLRSGWICIRAMHPPHPLLAHPIPDLPTKPRV